MFDLISLLKAVGYTGFFSIIFAESGILIGFFFPGDSLLFTAGFLASQGVFDIYSLLVLGVLGAVLGDSFGYFFGKKAGPKIFTREDSWFFHKRHLERARDFYARHGGKAIVLARFLPVIRTFAPILAGVGKMHYPTFLLYNIGGGVFWVLSLIGLGYFFGNIIPDADQYIIPIVILIIIISSFPTVIQIWRTRRF